MTKTLTRYELRASTTVYVKASLVVAGFIPIEASQGLGPDRRHPDGVRRG